jgi:hypothetical protein
LKMLMSVGWVTRDRCNVFPIFSNLVKILAFLLKLRLAM